MKVMICPICGGKRLGWDILTNRDYCLDCKKEIIPLVTPQEVR